MAVSTKVSTTGVWLLLGVLGGAGAQSMACSSKFSSCYAHRNCPEEPSAEAGAAGDESSGASGEGGQPTVGGSGVGGGAGEASTAHDGAAGSAGGDAGGSSAGAGDGEGCETPLNSLTNCGSCGNACTAPTNATASCNSSGVCSFSCKPGFVGTQCELPRFASLGASTSAQGISANGKVVVGIL